jgi:hypothetical protein
MLPIDKPGPFSRIILARSVAGHFLFEHVLDGTKIGDRKGHGELEKTSDHRGPNPRPPASPGLPRAAHAGHLWHASRPDRARPDMLETRDFGFKTPTAVDFKRAADPKFKGIAQMYRDLIALRRNLAGKTGGLTGQNLNVFHLDDSNKTLAYHRWETGGAGDDVVVVAKAGGPVFAFGLCVLAQIYLALKILY